MTFSSTPRVWCVGDMTADIFAGVLPSLPKPGQLVLSDRIALFPGGNALNTAVALERLGVKTRFFGCLGDDAFGDLLLSELGKIGLDTRGVTREIGSPTTATLIYRAEGEDRRFITALGADHRFTGENVPLELVPPGGITVAAGYLKLPAWSERAVRELLARARERDCTTVLNVCIPRHTSLAAERCLPLLPMVDVFVNNEDEARILTGKSAPKDQAQVLREAGARRVIITRGAGGLFAQDSDRIVEMGIFSVPLVDPTGCGDCFTAGLVASLLDDRDLVDMLRFATAVAAFGATALGCTTGVPSSEVVERFLEQNRLECRVSTT